ncbi:hypothetical protein PISL3812_09303 [Talaromyces islandicus]|uniref:Large ribosomal subunit protein bL28m n=1 Tax=Talaromyces islandicus TaxID=28573 RepID=A0A0U1MBC6_TALIS|nr:hypothetical protein PISL3812_09303 [Talaromyces islandicus]
MLLPSSSLTAAFRGLSLHSTTPVKRSFSTSVCLQSRKKLSAAIPPYPYKPNYVYKQADTGLYGGVSIQFGNKISKGRNKGKTRRSWKPNVRWKKIHSDALDKDLFLKVTRRALRTIEKCKGLDNYLLSDKPSRIKELGLTGWELRWKVMQTPKIQEQFAQERQKLRLPTTPPTFEEWVKAKEMEEKTLNQDTTFKSSVDIKHLVRPKRAGSSKVKAKQNSK